MALKSIKAVILDWAGSTVDFGCISPVESFIRAFKEENLVVSIKEVRKFMGYLKKDHVRALLNLESVKQQFIKANNRLSDESDVEKIYKHVEPIMLSTLSEYIEPIKGTLEVQTQLRNAGVKIGSTTGYSEPLMERVVEIAKEKGYSPDCWVCPTEEISGRPSPFLVFQNAKQLNTYPLNTMVKVGDTIADMQEGVNAGTWNIGLALSGNECGLPMEKFFSLSETEQNKIRKIATKNLKEAGAHIVIDGIWDLIPALEMIANKIENKEKP